MKSVWKPSSLVLAVVLGSSVHTSVALADEAQAHAAEPAAQAVLDSVTVTGRLVMPADVPDYINTKGIELADLQGTIVWEVPPVPAPYPEGFEEMTDDEKRAWVSEFRQSPEFQEYVTKARAQRAEQQKHTPTPVTFEGGAFRIEGLKPGNYILQAKIPHAKSARHNRATFGDRIVVPGDKAVAELDDMPLELNNVLMPGDVAPEWTAQTYDGGEIKLSDYRGKYVLIDFWATWCGPCLREIPNLVSVYNDYGGDRFEMIGLSLDKTIDLPKAYGEKNPSPYVHGYLGEWNKTETTAKAYGVSGIPSIWLIGPDGKIVARDLRGPALREAVRKVVEQGGVGTD